MKKQAFKIQEFVLNPAPVARSFRKALPSIIIILVAILSLSTATGREGTWQFTFEPTGRVLVKGSYPRLGVRASGDVFLLHLKDRNLWLQTSSDGGDSFDEGLRVNDSEEVASHAENTPLMVVRSMREFYVLWTAEDGHDHSSLRLATSTNWGRSFGKSIPGDPTGMASQSFYTLAVGPDGAVYAAWLDGRDRGQGKSGSSALYVAKSTNRGQSFEKSVRVALNVCPCCRPSIASTDAKTMHVGWRGVINDDICELPLNGRDIVQLALLKPGVSPSRRSSDSSGSGVQLSVGGRRPNQISFVLDQTDINDGNNNTPGSVSGVLLGVDTLQEFRVLTNSYSAEYGRSAGGVISAVTRSGDNQWHGSAFEFVRNSAFDAKNFFDPADQKIPHFARNQFGGVLSGPIARNRTFFLASYEGLRQRLGITNQAIVPNAAARNGDIPGLAKITVNPTAPGYLNLVPLPNGRDFDDGTGQFISSASNLDDEDFLAGRVDHRFSDRISIFGRYTFNNAKVQIPDNLRLFTSATASRNQYATAQLTRIFNERLLNNVRFSYNRSTSRTTPEALHDIDPALSFFPGQPLGQISVTGLFSIGPSRFGPNFNELNLFQLGDDLSWVVGRHSLKVGFDHRESYLPTSRPQSPFGFYQFTSLANFLRAAPASVELALSGSEAVRRWRQSMTAAYIQDDFRLSRSSDRRA